MGPRVVREQLAEHIDPDNLPTGDRPQYRSTKASPAAPSARPRPTRPASKAPGPARRRAAQGEGGRKAGGKAKPPKPVAQALG